MASNKPAGPPALMHSESFRDPYPMFQRLREEAPVHWVPEFNIWFISRYDDIVNVVQDNEHFSKEKTLVELGLHPTVKKWLAPLFKDDPDHYRLRSILEKFFSIRSVKGFSEEIEQIVRRAAQELKGKEEIDLLEQFAYRIPLHVLSLTLGLPKEDFPLFLKWAPGISDGFNPDKTSKAWQNGGVAYGEVADYLATMIKAMRRKPPAEPNVLSLLNDAHAAGVISEDELIGQAVLLFAGSHETTLNLIGLSAYTFLRHPQELAKVKRDPTLLEGGIDEVLRFDGPGHMCDRRVSQEIELHGVQLKENEAVWLGLGAGNRDERCCDRPDEFIIDRPGPSRHLGFSRGIHLCPGRHLSRLETRLAVGALFEAFPNMTLAGSPPLEYNENLFIHGLKHLPVRLNG